MILHVYNPIKNKPNTFLNKANKKFSNSINNNLFHGNVNQIKIELYHNDPL